MYPDIIVHEQAVSDFPLLKRGQRIRMPTFSHLPTQVNWLLACQSNGWNIWIGPISDCMTDWSLWRNVHFLPLPLADLADCPNPPTGIPDAAGRTLYFQWYQHSAGPIFLSTKYELVQLTRPVAEPPALGELQAVVWSGMCNRLLVLACAQRLSQKMSLRTTVLWHSRTGRTGLPWSGPLDDSWSNYFQPTNAEFKAANSAGIEPPIPLPAEMDMIDRESNLPYFLPRILNLPCSLGSQPNFSCGYINPQATRVLINRMTTPVGFDGETLPLVPKDRQVYRKSESAFWTELSAIARGWKLNHELQGKLDEATRLWPAKFSAVHIRGTDMGNSYPAVDRQRRLRSLADSNSLLFVCSDTLISDYPATVLQLSGHPKMAAENSIIANRHALLELFAMAKANCIFGTANSTFSTMAWLLSEADELHIEW